MRYRRSFFNTLLGAKVPTKKRGKAPPEHYSIRLAFHE